jgi:anti-anti-sigma factor
MAARSSLNRNSAMLKNGVLTVRGELLRADLPKFKAACSKLCAGKRSRVTLDLTGCTHMGSLFLGALADAVLRLKEQGKDVQVDVSPAVGKILHMACLFNLFAFKIHPAGND